jgi:hypothetical protein
MESSTLNTPQAGSPPVLRRFDQLPGPRGIPLLGNALQLDANRFHQQLEQWCQQFGPMFKMQIGNRHLLAVSDHQLIATTSGNASGVW